MDVTIIIYTYNRKDYILNALNSALKQTVDRDRYEIIVVKGFKDPIIDREIDSKADLNLYINEKAHGKKLVPAIMASTGDKICILDDDDEYLPTKLEYTLQFFKKIPDLLFVHHSQSEIDDSGNTLINSKQMFPPGEISLHTNAFTRRQISTFLKYRANWYSSCMTFRRDVLFHHLEELEKVDQSVDPFLFFMALASNGQMIITPSIQAKYRVHQSTTNYSVNFDQFISRRIEFYSNSIRIYKSAYSLFEGKRSESVLKSSIANLELIVNFLGTGKGRRELFKSILHVTRGFRYVLNRYSILWILVSIAKMLIGDFALKAYYKYSLLIFN